MCFPSLLLLALGPNPGASIRLKKPDFTPKHAGPSTPSAGSAATTPKATTSARRPISTAPAPPEPVDDISFRAVVEEIVSAANLVFLPTGKVAPQGQALFRVSKGIEGKGGVTVYLEDDVVWIAEKGGEYSPISVDEMIKRAGGAQ